MESVSGCVSGGVVEDSVLADGLIVGLELEGQDEAGVTVGAVLCGGGELPVPVLSEEEVWKCVTRGCGESWKSDASCCSRGDSGVEGSEERD